MPFVKSPPLMIGNMQDPADKVRRAAEDAAPIMAQALLRAWNGAEGALEGLPNLLLETRGWGRMAMFNEIGIAQPIAKALTVKINFDGRSPDTEDQAALNAARLVREIGDDQKNTLRAMELWGVQRGMSPPDIGRTMRESIGLTLSQAQAVQNYRRLLETGSTDALQRALRDQRFDVAPAALADLNPDQINQRVDAYRRRYLAYRATTIARYETLSAANGGAVNAIRTSIQAGTLPATTHVHWMIAHDERTCPRCRSIVHLQPDGVPMGTPFNWSHNGRSGQVMYAPLHPDCRCTNTFRVTR